MKVVINNFNILDKFKLLTGFLNIFLGYNSGIGLGTWSTNTFIGVNEASNLIIGSNNAIFTSNSLVIGDSSFRTVNLDLTSYIPTKALNITIGGQSFKILLIIFLFKIKKLLIKWVSLNWIRII